MFGMVIYILYLRPKCQSYRLSLPWQAKDHDIEKASDSFITQARSKMKIIVSISLEKI
jgi:hypothetical protein